MRSSKAFCEGADYRAGGTVLERPITDNPHNGDSEANAAWAAGWTVSDTASPSAPDMSGTCCAAITAVPA